MEVYLEIEKRKKEAAVEEEQEEERIIGQKQIDDGQEKYITKKMLREFEHIHNKSLFDSVNESIVQFRPYGKDGTPMPWSRKQRKLQQTPLQKEIDIKKMFEIIKHDVSFTLFEPISQVYIFLDVQMGNYASWNTPKAGIHIRWSVR